MGPVDDQREDRDCTVNFVFTKDGHVTQGNLRDVVSRERISKETKTLKDENETAQQFGSTECEPRFLVMLFKVKMIMYPQLTMKLWTANLKSFRRPISGTRSLGQEHCHLLRTIKL